jgi:hypothetical protein
MEERMKIEEARLVRAALAVTVTVGLAWVYCLIVLFMDEAVLGVEIRHRYLAIGAILGFCLIYWIACRAARQHLVSLSTLKNISLTTAASLLVLIAADVGYSGYLVSASKPVGSITDFGKRLNDPNIWVGELHPHDYLPTESNWHIFKPGVTVTGTHFGDVYSPEMLQSPTLVQSVLQHHQVSFVIDNHGFRELTAWNESRIFTLGDSFTFGWGLDQKKSWTELLELTLKEPVYNLGVHDASPKQEVMLLQHLLQRQEDRPKIQDLLWMIYEGNDLEAGYEDGPPLRYTVRDLFRNTIVEPLLSFPELIKHQSIIQSIRDGRVRLRGSLRGDTASDPYNIDGVRLVNPLYHSSRHGNRVFSKRCIELAQAPASYVRNHPNRSKLDRAFQDMALLSKEHHFRVTVVIMPTSERLYASQFEQFPAISEEPHFIQYVENLSSQTGFDVVNLYHDLRPYAEDDLLYFRDDDHLNERGSEIVAGILARYWGKTRVAHREPGRQVSPGL